ncbi:hypothetical protein DL93DRAFT_2153576 [Clavulina sp. PMI_390]|nr:hypothetical protein DL93DRAFT_2153576 [Clavulina sp. PMI_390]
MEHRTPLRCEETAASVTGIAKNRRENFISLLPIEILSEITLLAALPLEISIWKSPLLSISAAWRACAINTTRLWSCIWVTAGTHTNERLACWFQRSGNGCPLYLTVHDVAVFNKLQASWVAQDSGPNRGRRVRSIIFCARTRTRNSPFPLQFDTKNLCELEVYIPARTSYRLTPRPFFGNTPPLHLKRVKLGRFTLSEEEIDLKGLDASALTTLILTAQLPLHDVFDLMMRGFLLEQLDWYMGFQSLGSKNPPPAHIEMKFLQQLTLQGDDLVAHTLHRLQTPSLQILAVSGSWDEEELRTIVGFASQCQKLTHLKIFPEYKGPSAADVASLLYALPKLEHFDPGWDESNLKGLLALCGEFSAPTEQEHLSYWWACPNVPRLQLPLLKFISNGFHPQNLISRYLGRVLDVRCRQQPFHTSSAILAPAGRLPSLETIERLVLAVDVPIETMVSVVGRRWILSGGECVRSLDFPAIR